MRLLEAGVVSALTIKQVPSPVDARSGRHRNAPQMHIVSAAPLTLPSMDIAHCGPCPLLIVTANSPHGPRRARHCLASAARRLLMQRRTILAAVTSAGQRALPIQGV